MAIPDHADVGESDDEQSDGHNLQFWINDNLDDDGIAGTAALVTKIALELILAGGIVSMFLAVGMLSASALPAVSISPNELVRALAAGALGVYGIGTHCYYGTGSDARVQ